MKNNNAWAHEESERVRKNVEQPGQELPEKACFGLLNLVVEECSIIERDLDY